MSDEHTPAPEAGAAPASEAAPDAPTPEPAPGAAASDSMSDAWREVAAQLDGLGAAIARWARAAASDPSYKEHVEEVKAAADRIAASVGDAVDEATKSDVGAQFADAASKTGEAFKSAGEKVTDEVAPRLATMFGKAADKLHEVAARKEGEAAGADTPPPADPASIDA